MENEITYENNVDKFGFSTTTQEPLFCLRVERKEVVIRVKDIEKTYTIDEFLKRLGFVQ